MRLRRWIAGSGLGLVLALAYGPPWFFVGPLWALLLDWMDATTRRRT
ncbi:hypothetical protein [Thermus sp.]|nr:hypothetical protein [Thermus sp.]MCS6867194.1 hypothetical protein [Thermus sp.]MDW8358497.1 hypothetical protein [Thermus sp.]